MKLLKRDGKLVTKGGKLVRTDDPAKCECCGPPPPPVKYICATREDPCAQYPLDFGQWVYRSDGVWAIRRSRCAAQFPMDTCTIADAPSRPGAFAGEIVNVGCEAVTPNTTKECITEEEFNKGGWTKVSGPHDTLQICEAACNPPPPDYTTPGWYVRCVAAELSDNFGNATGLVQYSFQQSAFYATKPTFPNSIGDSDYAMKILAGPFATNQEAEAWIAANGGTNKACVEAGSQIRPKAFDDNPLP